MNRIGTGRNYNISVQTVSNGEISLPTTAQYRTVPLRPRNVTFDRRLVTSDTFQVRWEEPKGVRYSFIHSGSVLFVDGTTFSRKICWNSSFF